MLREPGMEGFELLDGYVPAYDPDKVLELKGLCQQNLCGDYGRTWACPPGYDVHMDALEGRFTSAFVLKRTYMVPPSEKDAAGEAGEEMQEAVRRTVALLRRSGRDCMGFSDGGCRYCGVCSYPEPCRFPEMVVPSLSALGVDLGAYLKDLGEEFSFRDDRVTLYGLILVSEPQ